MAAAGLLLLCAISLSGCASSLGSSFESGNSGTFTPTAAAAETNARASATPATYAAAGAESGTLSQAADQYTSAATPGSSGYKIGPMDVLDVSVFAVPDLSKSVQVGQDGMINFPLIGTVTVTGKTAHDVEQEMSTKLAAKYLKSPQVNIFVKEYNSQRVTVDGSVKHPGVYSLKGQTTLMQVLAMAEGVDMSVASGDVVVFRRIDGVRSAARFDVSAINDGKTEDPELRPGDVIVVDTSSGKIALQGFLRVLPAAATAAAFVPLL